MKKSFYFVAQTIFTGFCIFNGLSFNGFFYLFLIGVLNIIVCFLIVSQSRKALIVSLLFYVCVIIFYAYLYFDLLIVRGFINSPYVFPMMGDEVHIPIILYCIFAVILLGKYLRSHKTKADSDLFR